MKSSTVTLVFVFGVGVALAQTRSSTSSHSGWSIQDTLETAPDIVVGTVAASDCADSGAEVSCRATVRILRVVKGGLAPQANIQVHWDYHPGPLDGPEATRHVPDVTALWCLRSAADGGYAPLTVSFMPTYGGAVSPLRSTRLSPYRSCPLTAAHSCACPRSRRAEISSTQLMPRRNTKSLAKWARRWWLRVRQRINSSACKRGPCQARPSFSLKS